MAAPEGEKNLHDITDVVRKRIDVVRKRIDAVHGFSVVRQLRAQYEKARSP